MNETRCSTVLAPCSARPATTPSPAAAFLGDSLAKHGSNKAQALGDYVWALISSTEFFVNH